MISDITIQILYHDTKARLSWMPDDKFEALWDRAMEFGEDMSWHITATDICAYMQEHYEDVQ